SSSPVTPLSLLAKELHAVEHLFRPCARGFQPLAKALVFALELRGAPRELDARLTPLPPLELLQPRFGRLRATAKAGELVAQALQQYFQLGDGEPFTRCGV